MLADDNEFPKVLLIPGSAPTVPAGTIGLFSDSAAGNALKRVNSSGTVTPIEGGGGAAAFVGCKALRSTNQSLATATFTAIQFNDADEYDTDSIHDPATNNTRLTIPTGKSGVWRFTTTVVFATGTSSRRTVVFAKNGVQLSGIHGGQRLITTEAFLTTTLNITLAAGDYIEVLGEQATGGALNVAGASVACQFLG